MEEREGTEGGGIYMMEGRGRTRRLSEGKDGRE